ncbi:HAMP domain-containing histidine kinase [Myxococcota bacterium]|nr:HAMP domain-containing histidine kinase [Myxococcota bacterium]
MDWLLRRYGWLPLLALVLALSVWTTSRFEQDRQYESLRDLYENQARVLGRMVRESAQQAARSTGLVHQAFVEKAMRTLALLGVPGPEEDCAAIARGLPDVALWVASDREGLRGCAADLGPADVSAFLGRFQAAPMENLAEEATLDEIDLFCVRNDRIAPGTIACLDRGELKEMRREVGLGPLLAGLEGDDLAYVVVQDAEGILAATPGVERVSSFAEDPFLEQAISGNPRVLEGRMVARDGRTLFEMAAPMELADGTTAVIRTALDAQELVRAGQANRRRLAWMGSLLGAMVLLSALLAGVLARNARHREEYEREIERRDQEVRHWQALGEMAATVAHEVRNPLNTIGMALQRLDREVQVLPRDEPDFRELLGFAREATRRVERVVGDFLELGRPLVLHPERHPLDGLLREVAASLAMAAESESKRLEVHCPEGIAVRVDRPRFFQALTNLVLNAIQAVAPGGTVRISGVQDDGATRVIIRDDGPGMDAETLARVQQPFVTTRASGMGLGLPLARRLIEAHGASLEIESSPGIGTTATVLLPREEPRGNDGVEEDE